MKEHHSLSIGDAIKQFLQQHQIEDKTDIQKIILQWEKLMGKPIAQHTEKVWFHEGILYVKISSPVWRSELQLAKRKIIRLINQQLGRELVNEVRIF